MSHLRESLSKLNVDYDVFVSFLTFALSNCKQKDRLRVAKNTLNEMNLTRMQVSAIEPYLLDFVKEDGKSLVTEGKKKTHKKILTVGEFLNSKDVTSEKTNCSTELQGELSSQSTHIKSPAVADSSVLINPIEEDYGGFW